tara:strand:+ start:8521 stop:8688 length:168 start_codon:yes stop_codon:yes gene_type:complete
MIKYILLVLDKLLNYFKGINCKINSCCGSKCSSECSQKKKDDDAEEVDDDENELA